LPDFASLVFRAIFQTGLSLVYFSKSLIFSVLFPLQNEWIRKHESFKKKDCFISVKIIHTKLPTMLGSGLTIFNE